MLAALGEEFARVSGRKLRGVWAMAAKDARFIERVESGHTFTLKTFDSVTRWFSDNWPDGAAWPECVKRPDPMRVHADAEGAE